MTSEVAPGRRTRNRRGEGGLLRQTIISAATDLLDQTGSASAVTLRSVARMAGIAAPSIYRHFAGPEAILLAVVQDEFTRLRSQLRGAVEHAGPEPVDRLLAMCTSYLAYADRQPSRYLLLFGGIWNATQGADADAIPPADIEALGLDVLDDLIARLQDCVDGGRSTSADPATDAMGLWLGLHGLAHQRIVSRGLRWPSHIQDRLIRRLAYL